MKRLGAILLITCLFITGCAKEPEEKGFFAWMDGYLAMDVKEESSIALTLFIEKNTSIDTDKTTNLSFDHLDQIEIFDFSITPMETNESLRYEGYAFTLNIRAKESGIYKTDKLIVTTDNSSVVYMIGDWIFDITTEAILPTDIEETFNIWQSPAVGSNPKTFAYDYIATDNNIKLKELWIWDDVIVSDPEGLSFSNVIELPKTMNAPIHYIRPKIVLDIAGEEYITFGMSYYSGAMDIQENVLEKSRERSIS